MNQVTHMTGSCHSVQKEWAKQNVLPSNGIVPSSTGKPHFIFQPIYSSIASIVWGIKSIIIFTADPNGILANI